MSVSASTWRPSASLTVVRQRAQLLQQLRDYFAAHGILEVETPLLASSATTELHLQSFIVQPPAEAACRRYLPTSPELAMKRLLAAGYGSIYQISKVFRPGETGAKHAPEFTLLEWYRVAAGYADFIAENVALIATVLRPYRSLQAATQLTYRQAFIDYVALDPFAVDEPPLRAAVARYVPGQVSEAVLQDRQACLDLLLTYAVEPRLPRGLVVIQGYPAAQASLAALDETDPDRAQRFEIYCDGLELANGFRELTDADQQLGRIQHELTQRESRGLDKVPCDPYFIAAMQQGLPPCCGIAIGLDRVLMSAIGATHIDQVLAFPFDRI